MALTFPANKAAYYPAANWLDGIASFSFALWVRPDTITAGVRQYAFAHYGATNRISLRKNNEATELWRFAVVSGGVSVVVDDTTDAVAAGTVYHLAGTWVPGSATGIAIYRNGALVATASTTGQAGTYATEGAIPLYLGARKAANEYAKATIEGASFWAGSVLTAAQILSLYQGAWPHQIQATCSALYLCDEALLTAIPDYSGQGRGIEAATVDGATAGGTIGRWEDPVWSVGAGSLGASSVPGPPDPDPWALAGVSTHPVVEAEILGLTPGTAYEFCVTAVDAQGLESGYSAVAEATPTAALTTHVRRWQWVGH
jgi:hypothetical protein